MCGSRGRTQPPIGAVICAFYPSGRTSATPDEPSWPDNCSEHHRSWLHETPWTATSPTSTRSTETTRHQQYRSRSPPAPPTTTAANTTHLQHSDVSNLIQPTGSEPSTETTKTATAATRQPPTDPTTPHAQKPTSVPKHTSSKTSLVKGVATNPRTHRHCVRLFGAAQDERVRNQ